jgi:hypothetical protein
MSVVDDVLDKERNDRVTGCSALGVTDHGRGQTPLPGSEYMKQILN